MKRMGGSWSVLDVLKPLFTLPASMSGAIYQPQARDGELYSSPFIIPRSLWGLAGKLAVPDAACIVVRGQGGFSRIFGPGIHSLWGCPPGQLYGQLVDMSQHSQPFNLADLYTSDLANVSLQLTVEYRVANPWDIIQLKNPPQTLGRTVDSAVRQLIGGLPHSALFDGDKQLLGKTRLERELRTQFHTEPALAAIRIVSVKLGPVKPDPVYLGPAAEEIQAEQQFKAQQVILRMEEILARRQRALALYRVETEQLAAAEREKAGLYQAQQQATVFQLDGPRREHETLLIEKQQEHERELARLKMAGQVLGNLYSYHLNGAAAPYAYQPQPAGLNELMTQAINTLSSNPPAGSNGRSTTRQAEYPAPSTLEEE